MLVCFVSVAFVLCQTHRFIVTSLDNQSLQGGANSTELQQMLHLDCGTESVLVSLLLLTIALKVCFATKARGYICADDTA